VRKTTNFTINYLGYKIDYLAFIRLAFQYLFGTGKLVILPQEPLIF
jgi:hypothetical protein